MRINGITVTKRDIRYGIISCLLISVSAFVSIYAVLYVLGDQ